MKNVALKEQFITDTRGRRVGVILDLKAYEVLREAQEDLADIEAYDAKHARAAAEVARGQFTNLADYRRRPSRRKK